MPDLVSDGNARQADVVIVLPSMRAEGTPMMVLDLCREWRAKGLEPAIFELQRAADEMSEEYVNLGIPIHRHRFTETGYLRYLRLLATTYLLCRRLRPKALLSMPSGIHAFIAIGAKLAGVEQVVVHQGVYPWHWKRKSFRKYWLEYQIGKPFTDRVIACSHYVARGVSQHFSVKATEVETIYNGVNVRFFGSSRKKSSNRGSNPTPTLVMVGRLDVSKDHDSLIKAIQILTSRGIKLIAMLAGDGAGRSKLEQSVEQSSLAHVVTFLGVRSDVPEVLDDADIFVYSVKAEEGLGIALIEAMAAGVPVVASDVPACREVLNGGDLGILVTPGDPRALADGIAKVMDDWNSAWLRADRARDQAAKKFTTETMAIRYLAALEVAPETGRPA